MYTIFCLLEGESVSFPVEIDETKSVGVLKDHIKEKMSAVHVEAHKLELYRIDVDASDEQKAIKDVETLAQTLIPTDRLNPTQKLNKVFPSGAPDDQIHILVQVPEGESSSRPARDVAEIVLSLTTPCIVTCPHRVPTLPH